MQLISINNSCFGARFVGPPERYGRRSQHVTKQTLAEMKKISLDGGLSPEIYKKAIRKVHEIFPSDNFLISLERVCFSNEKPFHVNVAQQDGKHQWGLFAVPANPKYLPAKFISTCREIAQGLSD